MGQKDLTEKYFLLYPDVFADTLNVLVYVGKEVVRAENLLPAPSVKFKQKQELSFERLAMREHCIGVN